MELEEYICIIVDRFYLLKGYKLRVKGLYSFLLVNFSDEEQRCCLYTFQNRLHFIIKSKRAYTKTHAHKQMPQWLDAINLGLVWT